MSDKLSRFRNLERGRGQGPAGEGAAGSGGRFDALEGPAATIEPAAIPGAGGSADRFREPPPATSGSGLELDHSRREDQPFIRCAGCEADNNAHAASCFNCGSPFNTPAQRAFNERLWQQRREEAAREAEELARLQQQKQSADAMLSAAQRSMGAAIAAEVSAQTRARLESEELRDSLHGWGSPSSHAGRKLLERVPADLRGILAVVALALFLILLAIPKTRAPTFFAALIAVAIWVRLTWWGRRH